VRSLTLSETIFIYFLDLFAILYRFLKTHSPTKKSSIKTTDRRTYKKNEVNVNGQANGCRVECSLYKYYIKGVCTSTILVYCPVPSLPALSLYPFPKPSAKDLLVNLLDKPFYVMFFHYVKPCSKTLV
jgi:hypothetical protein